MWSRRHFIRTASLSVVGGIFVPKYERWFRPIRVPTAEEFHWYAALFDHQGQRLMKAPLTWFNDNWESHFPVMTASARVEAAALLNSKGDFVAPFDLDTGKTLMPSDQAILRVPSLIYHKPQLIRQQNLSNVMPKVIR